MIRHHHEGYTKYVDFYSPITHNSQAEHELSAMKAPSKHEPAGVVGT